MPADLADVWGDELESPDDGARGLSARVAAGQPAAEQHTAAAPPAKGAENAAENAALSLEATVELLLAEIAEMRREQTRRSAAMLVAAFLASASLLTYLERLHRQLRAAAGPPMPTTRRP